MIRHVRICNYKSIREVSVDLDPLTVIIGRSGTGKTNFVEALRVLRDSVALRDANSALQGGWPRVLSATTPRLTHFSIEVTFTAPRTDQLFRYSIAYEHPQHALHPQGGFLGAPALVTERLSLGERVLFHQANNKWATAPAIINPPAPNGLMLGALTGLPEVTRAFVLLSRGIGWYSFPDNVLLGPSGTPGAGQSQDQTGLADHGVNYMRAFNAILESVQSWGQQDEMLAALKHINPSIVSVDPAMPDRQRIVVGHGLPAGVLPLDLSQESEGVRRFLAYLLALYQAPPKQTLIFEEPEKGIHPGALALLAEELKACPEAGRGQVIMTTHSPDLLDHFPPESLRVVDMVDGATRIGPVEQDQCEAVRERLLHTGELLTVDLARPELPAAKDA